MTQWKDLLQESITSYDQLLEQVSGDIDPAVQQVITQFPMRINPYFLDLVRKAGRPLFLQAVPDVRELCDRTGVADPLAEEDLSPVANLVHKYPDRALFLVSGECALYCRFCTRKRKVGTAALRVTDRTIEAGLDYLRRTPRIREVLLSGGDPLLLDDDRLDDLLGSLRSIPSLEIIRIGSRVPCTLPMRVTGNLCGILKKYHPLYINTHFNHPAEITPAAERACTMLADAGIPLGCQTVLLRGVNDSAATMAALLRSLLRLRVKPYYLFQADLTRGTDHFRTTTAAGLAIMRSLIGHVSGLAVPTYALDAPGGHGKIPLTPDYVTRRGDLLEFTSYSGTLCSYPEI